jgi:hypothetical protein
VVFLSASKRTVRAYDLVGAEGAESPVIDAKGELHLAFGWLSGRYKSRTQFHIGLQGGDLVVRRYRFAFADSILPAGPDKV